MLDTSIKEYICKDCGYPHPESVKECKICGSKNILETPRIFVKNEFPNIIYKGA